MNGPYTAGSPGAPCHRCRRKIRIGGRVFYVDSLLDDGGRTCAACADDLEQVTA